MNMKKTYIKPAIKVIALETESLLAASIGIDTENKVDTSDPDNQLGRDNGGTPNVWEQGW